MKKTKRRRWPYVLIALLLLGGGVRYWLKGKSDAAKAIDQTLVTKVKRGDLEIAVIETGKVQPRERVEVKSKVAGQVERVFVDEGARVKKGQPLLRLDATDFRRDLARTEADVAQAKNSLEFAELNLERRKKGLEQRGVAQIDVDVALNEVKAKTVALRSAQVALGAAEDRLRYTQIYAPMDGMVIQRGIEPGEVVTPGVQATFEGKALLTVADMSQLIVKVELNQIDVAKVVIGQDVTLALDALPGKKYSAKVTKIAPAASQMKGKDIDVFPVEASLIEVDHAIKPGMTADVRIHISTKKGVLSLPIEGVTKEAGKSFVTKVVAGDKGQKRTEKAEVQVGARNDREVEIVSGIDEGAEVLIKPASSAENEYKM